MKNDLITSELLEGIYPETSPTIEWDQIELITPSHFSDQKKFIEELFVSHSSVASTSPTLEVIKKSKDIGEPIAVGVDSVVLRGWRNIENISARLIDFYEGTVVLECLVDRDNGVYEEREFRSVLFEGYNLKIGELFYLRFFDRPNETRMEVHYDPNLTSETDFPKKDFSKLFKESKLFKKKI